jgi:hypothetical protein
MLLFTAFLFISFEAIGEGLLKRFGLLEEIFDAWNQRIIALLMFGVWFIVSFHFDGYYIPVWKMITGFVFVRFLVFDVVWNLVRGVEWNYYGTTKWYDRIMYELAEWGWMMKIICGIISIVFLLGWK